MIGYDDSDTQTVRFDGARLPFVSRIGNFCQLSLLNMRCFEDDVAFGLTLID
jgi:hypothetical protein